MFIHKNFTKPISFWISDSLKLLWRLSVCLCEDVLINQHEWITFTLTQQKHLTPRIWWDQKGREGNLPPPKCPAPAFSPSTKNQVNPETNTMSSCKSLLMRLMLLAAGFSLLCSAGGWWNAWWTLRDVSLLHHCFMSVFHCLTSLALVLSNTYGWMSIEGLETTNLNQENLKQ